MAPICPTIIAQSESLEMNTLEEPQPSIQTDPHISHDPIYISGNDGFSSWPGTGSKQDPFVIEGLNITSPDYCIWVSNTTVCFVIRNCILRCTTGGWSSLTLNQVANGAVELCVSLDGFHGIDILSSVNCTVEECMLRGSTIGILMSEADNCTLSRNTVYLNQEGIELTGTNDSLVVNNTCFRNAHSGIRVLLESHRNRVFLNSLGWNPYEGAPCVNALDDGRLNLWDDNVSNGNFWNDYVGTGSYSIRGTAVSRDHFPSVLLDTLAPEVDHPDDARLGLGDTGKFLTWQAYDRFPYSYVLFWDGQWMDGNPWDGDGIRAELDDISVGVHNCSLLVYDIGGNTASDTVMVVVTFNVLGGLGTELVGIASAVSVVLMVAGILVVKAMR